MVYLEGLRLVDNQPALLLGEDVRTLVVADLHLGFEEELRGKGIRVPLQSHRLVDELCALGRGTGARRLVVVGDFKHNVTGPLDPRDRAHTQTAEEDEGGFRRHRHNPW
jgi:metallophosphoesterase superfamily enzyme